ncbi:MAG: DUF4198 domain-containing protein [Bordetella sp.]|nr:DUF4198 domain-containing protein [Bordetella sp.]
MFRNTLSLLTLAALAASAHAHQIWLEQPAKGGAVIRFGEFGENLREASPGLLDNFGKPSATLVSAQGEDKSAEAAKTANGFALPLAAKSGQSIVAEDASFPLRRFKQGDKDVASWFRPGARLITSFAEQQPKLALDLVPAGRPGEFKLFFKGQPLPKTKVTLVTQSGWAKEEHTNEQGLVKFDMPWKGQYVAEVMHIERAPGERPGANGPEKYDGVNHVTTLTYVKTSGVAPIPAGPVATPNK